MTLSSPLYDGLISEKEVGVVVVFKAMGVVSDQEIMQMVGVEPEMLDLMSPSLEECVDREILTAMDALGVRPSGQGSLIIPMSKTRSE